EGAPVRLDAGAARGQPAVDGAVAADDAGEVHLGDRLDDAGAADAANADAAHRLGKARLVRPELAADHLEARGQALPVDAHPLDGAGGGALAAADLRPLERRPGRRGGGQEPAAVP